MSTKKINKQLNKIQHLISTLEEDESLNVIEHQLLLDYIKRLYEEALSIKITGASKASIKIKAPVEPVVATPKVIPAPAPAPAPKVEEVVAAPIAPEPIAPVVTTPEPVVVKEEPIAPAPTKEAFIKPTLKDESSIDPKLLELFVEAKKQDLGGKLSQAPIKDLRKAFGINEKIFTIQELFGGDNQAYDKAINHLNDLEQYADAREYLINGVGSKYQWGEDRLFKKASKFIQLVRRRYN